MDPPVPPTILFLEDSEPDLLLAEAVLVREAVPFRLLWVRNRREYLAALDRPEVELVLSDFALGDYDGLAALKACRSARPLLPFILVSGHVGEETAVECLRQGATDYVSKGNLSRLPLVIRRAQAEVGERLARIRTEAVKTALLRAAAIAKVVPWRQQLPEKGWVFEESVSAVLGYAPEAFMNDPHLVGKLIHQEDLQRFLAAQAAEGSGKPVEFACRMRHRSGAWLRTRWTLAVEPGQIHGVLQDVSELHATQAQLIQSQKAETASVLVSGLCHDFNNLIAAIAGCAATLALEDLPGDQRETVTAIQGATERCQDLVRQLLGFARKDQEPRKTLRSMNSLAQEAATLLAHVRAEGVHLATELGPEPAQALVEPGQIIQVLLNLGMNALDALAGPGTITLRAGRLAAGPTAQGGQAYLEVEDTGCGIPPELLGRIYDPFFTTKPSEQGTGLGLAMVQAIVKDHDGSLECRSEPGRGTCFRVLLPEPGAPARPGPCQARDPAPVLLADDDDGFRTSWARTIRKAFGCPVLEARDGDEAVRIFRQHAPAVTVVILDGRMPGLSGPEAFLAIRGIRPGIKGILCSGDTPAALGTSVREHGFLAFLKKPFSLDQLRNALAAAGLPAAEPRPGGTGPDPGAARR